MRTPSGAEPPRPYGWRCAAGGSRSGDRPGDDLDPRDPVRCAARVSRASAQREFAQHYPAPRLGRARSRAKSGATRSRLRARRWRQRLDAGRVAGDRHHQPARDGRRLGPRDRRADPPRHRLAGPPHRRRLRRAARPTAQRSWSASGPACCSTPISPRPRSPGSSTMCPARGPGPSAASSRAAPSTASCCGG